MVVGKLIIIPALGHQNKGKSSFTGSGLFVLMSQCGNNNELAHHYVPCDRLLQKAYSRCFKFAAQTTPSWPTNEVKHLGSALVSGGNYKQTVKHRVLENIVHIV